MQLSVLLCAITIVHLSVIGNAEVLKFHKSDLVQINENIVYGWPEEGLHSLTKRSASACPVPPVNLADASSKASSMVRKSLQMLFNNVTLFYVLIK